MKLGIIGLEKSGKTTVFNALTGSDKAVDSFGKIEANIAVVKVPDIRLDWLSELYEPKKTVHTSIQFVDIPGSINDSSDPKIVAAAREVDALIFVVRTFEDPEVIHPEGSIDPVRDYHQIRTGLTLADMLIAEKRMEKLGKSVSKNIATSDEKTEYEVLKKIMAVLEDDKPATEAGLSEQEEKAVRSFQFLTLKPVMSIINISDNELDSEKNRSFEKQIPDCMTVCANIETEILKLDEADREDFLRDIGLEEPSINPFIRKAYSTLGLISFFTVGKDEVRAWTINSGLKAPQAAGKIHTDLERGFIRAEVFSFKDLKEAGSERELKKTGKIRLEGKEYIVRDGDILNIKFSV